MTDGTKRLIYADHAATTRLSQAAYEAMAPLLLEEYANPSSPYSFSRSAKKALQSARETIAGSVGAEPDEIFFTSGGTESDNWAIKGTTVEASRSGVVASAFEHHAVLNACRSLERAGRRVVYVSPDDDGVVLPETLEESLTPDVGLVSVMLVNNELGTIQRVDELCRVAHSAGAFFHTDAVQAVGRIPVDVKALGVDLLSASAHKFNGPRGVGFLYVRRGTPIMSLLDGGSQERGLRGGTENVAGIVGMAVALAENCTALEETSQRLRRLEARFLARLAEYGVSFRRNGVDTVPGLLSLSFPGRDGEALLHRLDLMGICVATGAACDSRKTEISHVLRSIRLDEALALGTIRVSLGRETTENDVESIASALKKILVAARR